MPGMNLKMNQNSIFAVLLRSPWWISGGLAAALFTGARLALPAEYALYAFFVSLPFTVIAVYTGWQHLRAPSDATVVSKLDQLKAMTWLDFSAGVEEAFRHDGYVVGRVTVRSVDFELTKAGRVSLVSCKRWKVARTGIEPLRELDEARQARKADESIYIATGEFTDTARSFAAAKNIDVISGPRLAKLLRP